MTTTHRIGTTALLILSLAAAGAPAASAMPVEETGIAANSQSSTAARPNPDQQTVTRATANPTPATDYSRQDKSIVPTTSPSPAGSPARVTAAPPVVRVQAPANGFDWGDAGIGAAGGLALSLIGLGGALAVSQHRNRRTHHTTS